VVLAFHAAALNATGQDEGVPCLYIQYHAAVFRGARGRCLAVALDGMVFHEPVYVGDEVGRYAAILRAGKTSMTVRIDAWRRGRTAEDKYNVTEATFTFVALDEDSKSRLVPSALIRGTLEQALYPANARAPFLSINRRAIL
jgi:acyl-CoA hydrolase